MFIYSMCLLFLDGRLAGTLIHCVLLLKQTFSFSSVTVKNTVRVRVSSRVRVRVRF